MVPVMGSTKTETKISTEEYEAEVLRQQLPTTCSSAVHAALGLSSETGEICDLVKKSETQGAPILPEKALEEGGDALWYLTLWLLSHGFTLEQAMRTNAEKLQRRSGYGKDPAAEAKIFRRETRSGGR